MKALDGKNNDKLQPCMGGARPKRLDVNQSLASVSRTSLNSCGLFPFHLAEAQLDPSTCFGRHGSGTDKKDTFPLRPLKQTPPRSTAKRGTSDEKRLGRTRLREAVEPRRFKYYWGGPYFRVYFS